MSKVVNLQRRIPYLDIVRVIACSLVVLLHAPEPHFDEYYNTPCIGYAFYIIPVTICSKLFFMLSGALLLPVKRTVKEFLPRRLKVVIIPLAVWSVLYILERIFLTHDFTPKVLTSILFHPVEPALWFVYQMIVIYITMPLMSKCIDAIGKRGVEIYLLLWTISSLIPYEHGIFLGFDQNTTQMFAGFANTFGYVILGYYLHQYPLPVFTRRHGWKFALLFFFGIVVMPLFEFTVQSHFGVSWQEHLDTVTHNVSINDVMMGTLIFSFAQRFAPKSYVDGKKHTLARAAAQISMCSFGIYLAHKLILRQIVWPLTRPWLEATGWFIDGVTCAVLTFALAYVIMRAIYHLPFSKYIIGH